MPKFKTFLFTALLVLTVFALPIEHKYDKPLRHLSASLFKPEFSLPHYFEKNIYFYASDIAAIFLFLLALFAFRTPLRKLLSERGAPFLWLFLSTVTLSIAFSPLASYATLYTRLLSLLSSCLLFAALASAHEQKLPLTQILLATLIVAGTFQSILAIAQYFSQAHFGLRLLGEAPNPHGYFTCPQRTRWLLDHLFHYQTPTELIARASGTLPHANVLGGFLALSLLAIYPFFPRYGKFLAPLFSLQFFAMALAFSRSALFGWALGTAFWFFRSKFFPNRLLAATIAITLVLTSALLFEQYNERGGVTNYNSLAQGSDAIRLKSQSASFAILKGHPFLGVGYQQFSYAYPPPYAPPHNIYLLITSETGLLSLLSFLAFLAALFFRALRAPPAPWLTTPFAMFLTLLFIGCCDFYPLSFQQGRLLLFLTAGLLALETARTTQRTFQEA